MSTPGAYWLNPALPRDLEGRAVDPTTGAVVARAADGEGAGEEVAQVTEAAEEEEAEAAAEEEERLKEVPDRKGEGRRRGSFSSETGGAGSRASSPEGTRGSRAEGGSVPLLPVIGHMPVT